MRIKLGRPRLSDYADFVDESTAAATAPVTVTWSGVTTLLFTDGNSAVLTDGFFSRPSIASIGLRRVSPNLPRIRNGLERLGVDRLDAVVPVHTHFDHAMDSAAIAHRTGAVLVGGTSAAHLGYPLPNTQVEVVRDGEPRTFGGVRDNPDRGRALPARQIPGADHRSGGSARPRLGLPLRRGVDDACAAQELG
ncbi:hypothetical protein TPB0596_39050 [Tsukamurella pulmonis]|nr:hypothetical protein TPB0596_39050 [Tsukamurella pulmonis]